MPSIYSTSAYALPSVLTRHYPAFALRPVPVRMPAILWLAACMHLDMLRTYWDLDCQLATVPAAGVLSCATTSIAGFRCRSRAVAAGRCSAPMPALGCSHLPQHRHRQNIRFDRSASANAAAALDEMVGKANNCQYVLSTTILPTVISHSAAYTIRRDR
jgi:hypothetical protein